MKHRVRLTRISGGEALRSDTVEGVTSSLPQCGRMFVMQASPLNPAAFVRQVNTSQVTKIEYTDAARLLHTQTGSIYELEVLDDDRAGPGPDVPKGE